MGGWAIQPGSFQRADVYKMHIYRDALAEVRAAWVLYPGTATRFSGDVPVGSSFYHYVETAVRHSMVGSDGDGTFRPADNATRGQISKIIYYALGSGAGCGPPLPPPVAP